MLGLDIWLSFWYSPRFPADLGRSRLWFWKVNAQEGRIRTRCEHSAKIRLVGICSEIRTGRYVRIKSGLVRIGSGEFKGASRETYPSIQKLSISSTHHSNSYARLYSWGCCLWIDQGSSGIPVFCSLARRWLDWLTELEGGRGNRKPGYLECVLISFHKRRLILIHLSMYCARLGDGEGSAYGCYASSFI